MATKVTIRIDEKLFDDIGKIAEEENQSLTFCMQQALKLYRDYYYIENKASFIFESLQELIKANTDYAIQRINNKTNQVLSEVAIQSFVQNEIIANELDVSPTALRNYRSNATDFLKSNNRVFRLDELVK